jgi:hypothetical protein
MSKQRMFAVACTAVAVCAALVLVAGVSAGEAVKSGPQVGEDVPGPFYPLNINGAGAGQKNCLYCQNGTNPVAMVFARSNSPELTALVKKLDACTAKNSEAKMGSFVVYLSEEEKLEGELKDLAKKEELKKIILSIDNPAGPKAYKVAKDADVTVVLYTDHSVKANHTFKKGELKDKDIEKIVGDVSKILPQK